MHIQKHAENIVDLYSLDVWRQLETRPPTYSALTHMIINPNLELTCVSPMALDTSLSM